MPENYWANLRKRAWLEAAEVVGLNSRPRLMVGLVAVFAMLAALAFWGSADAARDETIARIAAAAIIVAVIICLYVWKLLSLPPLIHHQQQLEIDQLKATLEPRIFLTFESTPKFITRTKAMNLSLPAEATFIRMRAVNQGDTTAVGCRAKLLDVSVVTGKVKSLGLDVLDLVWSNQPSSEALKMDLAKGIPQFIDIVYADSVGNRLTPAASVVPMTAAQLFRKNGTYRITVQVIGTNVKSDPVNLDVTWSGRWDHIIAVASSA